MQSSLAFSTASSAAVNKAPSTMVGESVATNIFSNMKPLLSADYLSLWNFRKRIDVQTDLL
jgi:hypothetical protein